MSGSCEGVPIVDTVLPEPAELKRRIRRVLHLVRRSMRRVPRLLQFARRSIPKSLLLALLGIGLSSWLIPAITRQWDDRQKAGDLKATLVAQMATATGRALLDAQALYYTSPGSRPSSAAIAAGGREWSVAALEIRARLDAYFGPEAVESWEYVTYYVDATLSRAYLSNDADAFIPGRFASWRPGPLQDLYSEFYAGNISMSELAPKLLAQEESVARSVLTMPVRGYSTTWHDIFSDLLPNV